MWTNTWASVSLWYVNEPPDVARIYTVSRSFVFQFVGVEGFVTAIVDMFPNQLRRDKRREIFIAIVCIVSFFIGLSMVTNVSKHLFIYYYINNAGLDIVLIDYIGKKPSYIDHCIEGLVCNEGVYLQVPLTCVNGVLELLQHTDHLVSIHIILIRNASYSCAHTPVGSHSLWLSTLA